MRTAPEHFWQFDPRDHVATGKTSTMSGMAIAPGARCRACHLVLFESLDRGTQPPAPG